MTIENETIVNWFDPQNVEHLRAYKHLCAYGRWSTVDWMTVQNKMFTPGWQIAIMNKIVDAYLEDKIV